MAEQYRKSLWLIVMMAVIAAGAVALVIARTKDKSTLGSRALDAAPPENSFAMVQGQGSTRSGAHRNLSIQPEAFNMGRRLGKRFSPNKRDSSILVGTLTIGDERRIVQTTRSQTDEGEQVEIRIAGHPGILIWDTSKGTRLSSGRANGSDRQLVERLVLDSPDQFVMAQLRGASYSIVARNVRPAEADENYVGPLWTIVRVGEPKGNEEKRPQCAWRLYYINTSTGLIDRIVSEFRGETVEATITDWTIVSGESVPGQINWSSNGGQPIMKYELTNFTRANNN